MSAEGRAMPKTRGPWTCRIVLPKAPFDWVRWCGSADFGSRLRVMVGMFRCCGLKHDRPCMQGEGYCSLSCWRFLILARRSAPGTRRPCNSSPSPAKCLADHGGHGDSAVARDLRRGAEAGPGCGGYLAPPQRAVRPRPRPVPDLCGHDLAVPERRRRVLRTFRNDIAKDDVGY